jgi:hypothetical protein
MRAAEKERQPDQRRFRTSLGFRLVIGVMCSITAIARNDRRDVGPVAQQHTEELFQHVHANMQWVMLLVEHDVFWPLQVIAASHPPRPRLGDASSGDCRRIYRK